MNALTKQLADALRSVQWDSCDRCPKCDREAAHDPRCAVALALAAFDAAKDKCVSLDFLTPNEMEQAVRAIEEADSVKAEFAALKSARPNLQPLHDLVDVFLNQKTHNRWGDHADPSSIFIECASRLNRVIAKLQSAEVKP